MLTLSTQGDEFSTSEEDFTSVKRRLSSVLSDSDNDSNAVTVDTDKKDKRKTTDYQIPLKRRKSSVLSDSDNDSSTVTIDSFTSDKKKKRKFEKTADDQIPLPSPFPTMSEYKTVAQTICQKYVFLKSTVGAPDVRLITMTIIL